MVKKLKKSYETPSQGWDSERIDRETDYLYEYGLTEKRELWKTESLVRNFRREARKLNAAQDKQREEGLINKLERLGVIKTDSGLADVLDLDMEDLLERRLQSIVYRKGLAETMKQARQYINHGHIMIGDHKVDVPGYLVTKQEEDNIKMAPGSKSLVSQ
mgnify:CR=1 FL=1